MMHHFVVQQPISMFKALGDWHRGEVELSAHVIALSATEVLLA